MTNALRSTLVMKKFSRIGVRVGLAFAVVASAAVASVAMTPSDDRVVQAVGELSDEPLGAGGEYHTLTPQRILDTRFPNQDVQPYGRKLTDSLANSVTFDVPVVGLAGLPEPVDADRDGFDDHVLAVVVSIVVVEPTQPGWLRAFPAGLSRVAEGDTATVNFLAGSIVPNSAVVRPGADGKISLRLVTDPGVGEADVVVDISGWFSTRRFEEERGARLIPISPIRAYDSELSSFGGATLGAGSRIEVPIRGAADVVAPSGEVIPDKESIVGVVVNVSGVNAYPGSRPTYISALPEAVPNGAEPSTATVNLQVGQVKGVLAIVPIGEDGSIHLFNLAGEIRLVVDIMGYLETGHPEDTREGRVVPLVAPYRVFDTREQQHKATPLGPARSEPWSFDAFVHDVKIDGEWVGDQIGLLGNLTATNLQRQYPSAPVASYITAYPSPPPGVKAVPPVIANLNIVEGDTVPNLALLRYGGDAEDPHRLQFYNRAGYVDYVLDAYAVVLAD